VSVILIAGLRVLAGDGVGVLNYSYVLVAGVVRRNGSGLRPSFDADEEIRLRADRSDRRNVASRYEAVQPLHRKAPREVARETSQGPVRGDAASLGWLIWPPRLISVVETTSSSTTSRVTARFSGITGSLALTVCSPYSNIAGASQPGHCPVYKIP